MKILYQTRGGVTEDAIHGYFSSRGILPEQYSLIDIDRIDIPTIDPDWYVVSGYESYKYLSNKAYMGFRNHPTWDQIKRLRVIALHDGARIVIANGYLDNLYEVLDDVLYARLPEVGNSLPNNITLKNPDDIINACKWILDNVTQDEFGGIDYETTGMYDTSQEDNKNFRATGVSVSFRDFGYFFDFRFLGDRRDEVMEWYRKVAVKFQQKLYAFNALFEVTTTLFEIQTYCEFCELRHFWVEDGFQSEWPTFKYMARYYIHVPDWDHEFEIMSSVFGEFYALTDRHPGTWDKFLEFIKRMRVGQMMTARDLGLQDDDLMIHPKGEYDEPKTISDIQLILSQFDQNDLDEFNYLCNDPKWNCSPFGIIPSRYLGFYCNLDAFYTKECVRVNLGRYPEFTDEVYRMNQKYGNLLHVTGLWKDVPKYNDQWKITNQVLTHTAIGLSRYIYERRIKEIESGKIVTNQLVLGNPEYQTLAPTKAITNPNKKFKERELWSKMADDYMEVPFSSLGVLATSDPFYELWHYIADWRNPYLVAKGFLNRMEEYYSSGKLFDPDKNKVPRWLNAEYEYWNVLKYYCKFIQENEKRHYHADEKVISNDFAGLTDDMRSLVLSIGKSIFEMAVNYHYHRVMDRGAGDFYETRKVISEPKYYDHDAKVSDPIYVKFIKVPENAPGFINDILESGWELSNIYYYVKSIIMDKLYSPYYEKNQDPNNMEILFGGYDTSKAKTSDPKYQYSSLVEEINDWLFWKQDVIDENLPKKISVVKGLDKVLRRVIREYMGEVDYEEFALTSEYQSAKRFLRDIESIPELQGITSHEQIPDEITFRGEKMTTEAFQLLILRSTIGLTGPEKYNNFADNLMHDFMPQHKFGIFIGQYGDIYDRHMKKSDVSGLSWIDKFCTEFKEIDYSVLDVISEKNWTRRNELARVKLLLVNEFKNLLLDLNASYIKYRENAEGLDAAEIVECIKADHARLVPEYDKFRFMGIYAADTLQVLKYEAEQAAGALEVTMALFPEEGNDLNKVLNEWGDTLARSFEMVKNVVSWDQLTPEGQNDFMLRYGSIITGLAKEVADMYQTNTGTRAKDYAELIQTCLDNLTDVDKSWVVNEDLEMTDWLVSHLYTASYLCDRYGDEFTDEYVKYLDNMDFDNTHPLYAYKIMFMQRAFKKYNKIYTYLTGTLVNTDCKYSNYNFKEFYGTRYAEEGEEVKAVIMRPHWDVNTLQSKRWASNWHTVPSKSECKGIAGSPDDCLLSYMDISACEPRSIAKMSGDERMQYYFDNDIDMYIECAEIFLGHKILDKSQKKYYRSIFKTILLLILYNGGAATTASQTGLTLENAQKGIDVIKSKFPVLIEFINEKVQYCLDNNGKIDTVLKDIIWGTKDDPVKQTSQGINQVIQNYASVVLAYGYGHLMHMAIEKGLRIRSISMVHDSIQCLFDIHLLPIIQQFYTEHYQSHLKELTGIFFRYDLEIGDNYYDLCEFNCTPDGFTLEGTNKAINLILKKLVKNNMPYEIIKQKNSLDEVYWPRYKDCLFSEGEAKYHPDHAYNSILFKLI